MILCSGGCRQFHNDQGRNPEMARALLREMQELGHKPDRFAWNAAISAHSRSGDTAGRIRCIVSAFSLCRSCFIFADTFGPSRRQAAVSMPVCHECSPVRQACLRSMVTRARADIRVFCHQTKCQRHAWKRKLHANGVDRSKRLWRIPSLIHGCFLNQAPYCSWKQ